jgi:hypothetical protein
MRRSMFAFGALWGLVMAGIACSQSLPAALAGPRRCGGNPCATLNCPSAYTCVVDNNCSVRCEAERVGNKPF